MLGRQEQRFRRDVDIRADRQPAAAVEQDAVVDVAVAPEPHTTARGDVNAALERTLLAHLHTDEATQHGAAKAVTGQSQHPVDDDQEQVEPVAAPTHGGDTIGGVIAASAAAAVAPPPAPTATVTAHGRASLASSAL